MRTTWINIIKDERVVLKQGQLHGKWTLPYGTVLGTGIFHSYWATGGETQLARRSLRRTENTT